MTKEDWERLHANLALPVHTPLKTQVDLLKDDVLKLVTEVMHLRNRLASEVRPGAATQRQLAESHAAGAEAMRQATLEVACPDCTAGIIRLSSRRNDQ